MEVEKILKEFIDLCSEKLNLKSIIQFGSSTYSKNYDDIDLFLCSEEEIRTTKEILKLNEIIGELEKSIMMWFLILPE